MKENVFCPRCGLSWTVLPDVEKIEMLSNGNLSVTFAKMEIRHDSCGRNT